MPLIASKFTKSIKLLWGFDPFGDGAKAQVGGEFDDRGDDLLVLDIGAEAGDEGAVDFDEGQGEAAEVGERGVAGAEVVEADLHAQVSDLIELLEHFGAAVP